MLTYLLLALKLPETVLHPNLCYRPSSAGWREAALVSPPASAAASFQFLKCKCHTFYYACL